MRRPSLFDTDINVNLYVRGVTQTTIDPSAPSFPAHRRRALLLLAVAAFWTVTLEMLPAGLLPAMTEDLGVRPSRVGLLVTVWAVTVALTSIPLTWAVRRLGRPTVLGVALGVLGTSTLATALAPSYGGVLVARLVAASGHGVFWSVVMVYAAAIAPAGRQGRAIAAVNAGPLLATAVGLPLGTALGSLLGWRGVVGTVGLAMVVAGIVLPTLLPPVAGGQGSRRASRRDPTAQRVVATAALGALALFAHFAAFTFVAPVTTQLWDFQQDAVSGLLLVFGIAGALGLAATGWWGDRHSAAVLVATILGLAATLVVLAVPGRSVPLTYVAVAVWGVLLGMLPPLLQSVVIGSSSTAFRATAGAVLVATFNLGIASGATAGGLVIDHLGIDRLLPLAAATALLSAAGLTALRRRRYG